LVLEELTKQIPVIVGGLLAIAGGAGSQALVHVFTQKRENDKLLRERLEALVKSVYASAQWLDNKRLAMIFRNEDHDTPSPLDDARMIQALHFPELSGELVAVQQAHLPMLEFIHQQKLKHMQDKTKFIAEWDPAAYNEAYKGLLAATNALVLKARQLLPK